MGLIFIFEFLENETSFEAKPISTVRKEGEKLHIDRCYVVF